MSTIKKICVLGGGSFGTAIANIAASNAEQVMVWMRNEKQCESISRDRENVRYLPGYPLKDNLIPTTDLQLACSDADLVFVAIPSKAFRSVMQEAIAFIPFRAP